MSNKRLIHEQFNINNFGFTEDQLLEFKDAFSLFDLN